MIDRTRQDHYEVRWENEGRNEGRSHPTVIERAWAPSGCVLRP